MVFRKQGRAALDNTGPRAGSGRNMSSEPQSPRVQKGLRVIPVLRGRNENYIDEVDKTHVLSLEPQLDCISQPLLQLGTVT